MGILRRNLVVALLGTAFVFSAAGILAANAAASTPMGTDYCKAARSFLSKNPLTSRPVGHMAIATTPSPGVLYIPVGPLAIPVVGAHSGKITALEYFRSERDGVYGFESAGQAGFVIVPDGFLANHLRFGISRQAAFGLPIWKGENATAHSPWSPEFWETLAKKRELDGVHLFESIAKASLSDVECSPPSGSDWSTLYALFARKVLFFMDPRDDDIDTLSADVYKHWFVFRIKIKSNAPGHVAYKMVVADGKGYLAFFTVRKADGATATEFDPVRRGAIKWAKQPGWVQQVAKGIFVNSPSEWEALTDQLRAAGIVVRKAGPSKPTKSPESKPNS